MIRYDIIDAIYIRKEPTLKKGSYVEVLVIFVFLFVFLKLAKLLDSSCAEQINLNKA